MNSGWTEIELSQVLKISNQKLGPHVDEPSVFAVSKYDGVILSSDFFGKRIASKNLDGYKILNPGDWVYSTIHIDEGSIAVNHHPFLGVVSPMYTTMSWCSKNYLPEYFELLLRSPSAIITYGENAQGSVNRRRSLSFDRFSQLKFMVPTLTEQKRIVDLISSVDSYIESLQKQLESLKKSRNAVLHKLLTAHGEDWIETTLGEASEVIMGRQLSPSKKLGARPRPYIRAANIGSWGINLEDIYEMDFTEIEEERFACQVGDTILVEGGNEKSVGCPALITKKESGFCIQNTVIRSRSRNSRILDPNFQYHLLRFMFWRGDFAQLCAGTTIMHLGQKRAEVVPISIPPLGEQLSIVDTISKFDSVVTYSEETLNSAKSLRSGLLSDLLSGEHQIPSSYDKIMDAS